MRDWDTGWVHAGWGKGGTNGSGLLWLTVSATPNFIRGRRVSATLLFIHRSVLSAIVCDFGTYLPMGKCFVALVLILGWGRRENVGMTRVSILGVCVCNPGPYPWGGVLIHRKSSYDWP